MLRAEARVDLNRIRDNVTTLRAGTSAEVMAVVKADGYGHGILPSARAALAGGAAWLGTATFEEALTLRAAGIDTPVLAWLWTVAEYDGLRDAVAAAVDISVNSIRQLRLVGAAARETGTTARVQLKADTGLSRNGAYDAVWADLVREAGETEGVEATGVWSHLACADEPGHPSVERQITRYREALAHAEAAGLPVRWRHLGNSAAALTLPQTHFDLVRAGIGIYGLSPVDGDHGLVPAMTLRATLANVKRVRAGEGVSYGHTYTTDRETTLALVPLGYGDGVPRHASNTAPVAVNGRQFRISGRVCMDQFVVDVGDLDVGDDDEAVLFGPGTSGEPRAHDWAEALDTIHYEIVTRIGARVPRTYVELA